MVNRTAQGLTHTLAPAAHLPAGSPCGNQQAKRPSRTRVDIRKGDEMQRMMERKIKRRKMRIDREWEKGSKSRR